MGEAGTNLTMENMLIGYNRIQNVAIRLSKQERRGIYNEISFLLDKNPSSKKNQSQNSIYSFDFETFSSFCANNALFNKKKVLGNYLLHHLLT